jgi:hypothetical protein
MRLYVVNVGANTKHARELGLRSPVFPDGSFEFIPIPEEVCPTLETLPTYGELPSWTGTWTTLAPIVPAALQSRRVHADPDFALLTYGDAQKSRGSSLADAAPGDELWFLARLWDYGVGGFRGPSAFHFVARYELEANEIVAASRGLPRALHDRAAANPHWKRMDAGWVDRSRVLLGAPARSARFRRAIPVTPAIAAHLFVADAYDHVTDRFFVSGAMVPNKNGNPRRMRTFGSVTRTVQVFLDSEVPGHVPHIAALEQIATEAGAAFPRGEGR